MTKKAATVMPTAEATPSPRVVGMRDSSRVSTPTTTVVALLSTGSAVRRAATAMAARRSEVRRSSSR